MEKNTEIAMVLLKYLNKGEPVADVIAMKNRMTESLRRELLQT